MAGVTRQMNFGAPDRRPGVTAPRGRSKQWTWAEMDGFEILLKVGTTGFSDRWKESVLTPRFSVKQPSGWLCHLQRQERLRGRVAGGGCGL